MRNFVSYVHVLGPVSAPQVDHALCVGKLKLRGGPALLYARSILGLFLGFRNGTVDDRWRDWITRTCFERISEETAIAARCPWVFMLFIHGARRACKHLQILWWQLSGNCLIFLERLAPTARCWNSFKPAALRLIGWFLLLSHQRNNTWMPLLSSFAFCSHFCESLAGGRRKCLRLGHMGIAEEGP